MVCAGGGQHRRAELKRSPVAFYCGHPRVLSQRRQGLSDGPTSGVARVQRSNAPTIGIYAVPRDATGPERRLSAPRCA